jgi:hypothetical protein
MSSPSVTVFLSMAISFNTVFMSVGFNSAAGNIPRRKFGRPEKELATVL